jgi:Fungal Zn(2)-Cys(6) binuclear cluster domain
MQVRLQNIPALKQSTSPLNRTQRKKCDEEKPICLRCVRSGKRCEGLTDYASPLPVAETLHLSSPYPPLSIHLKTDPTQSRFAELGFEILAQQAFQDAFGIGAKVWTCLLPQLSSINPTINAAVASLGATYEAVVLRPVHSIGLRDSLAAVQYHKALVSLRLDVLLQSHGPIPSFLASILLAAVEVLSHHYYNAVMHLHGAHTIMT